jgi:hypothetical protein
MEPRARKDKPLRDNSLSDAIIPASVVYVNETSGLLQPFGTGIQERMRPA